MNHLIDFEENPIIAAVRSYDDFKCALSSSVSTIFVLACDLLSIDKYTEQAHAAGKKLFIHIDFLDGISKDNAGVSYLLTKNIDGIISTRTSVIKCASEKGIPTVQRFFMVDSRSVDTAIDSMHSSRPDMIEIMPAVAYKTITKIKNRTNIPIIAGGLVEKKDEIFAAISAGASGVSTAAKNLWEI